VWRGAYTAIEGKFIVHCKSTVCTGGYAYGVGVLSCGTAMHRKVWADSFVSLTSHNYFYQK